MRETSCTPTPGWPNIWFLNARKNIKYEVINLAETDPPRTNSKTHFRQTLPRGSTLTESTRMCFPLCITRWWDMGLFPPVLCHLNSPCYLLHPCRVSVQQFSAAPIIKACHWQARIEHSSCTHWFYIHELNILALYDNVMFSHLKCLRGNNDVLFFYSPTFP